MNYKLLITSLTIVALTFAICVSAGSYERIVSLAPSCTEIVVGLGLQEKLVGITEHVEEPEEILKLPRVGSYVNLNVERIASLNPDLVLATNDGNPEATLAKLRRLKLNVLVLDLTTYDNIRKSVEATGGLLGRAEKGFKLSAAMKKTADCIDDRTKLARRPRVLFIYDSYPIVTAGGGTFTDELIRMSGGESITSSVKIAYPRMTIEHVIARDPEVVIATSMDPATETERELKWWRQWSMISAVKNQRVYILPSKNLDRPSQRIVTGFQQLARTIHPELFANDECR